MGSRHSFAWATPARRRPSPGVSSHDCPGSGPGSFFFPIAWAGGPKPRVAPAVHAASLGRGAFSSVRRNALPSFDATVPSNCQSPVSSVSVSMLAIQHGREGQCVIRQRTNRP